MSRISISHSRRVLRTQLAQDLSQSPHGSWAERTLTRIFSRSSCSFTDGVSGRRRTYENLVVRENHFPTIERAIEATGYRRIPQTLRDMTGLDDSPHCRQVARLRGRLLATVLDTCLESAKCDAELDAIVRSASPDHLDWIVEFPDDFHVLRHFQMGDICFTDQTMLQEISANTRAALQPQTLALDHMPACILGAPGWMKSYTAATMIALSQAAIFQHGVIEAGSADGSISLMALSRGAAQAVLLDRNSASLKRGNAHARLNKIEKHRWCSIQADLTKVDEAIPLFPTLPAQSVLVSNIGNWHEYFPMNNGVALQMIPLLETRTRITALVLGGYVANNTDHSPERDFRFARELGFTAPVHCAQVGTAQAFVLQRPVY